MNTCLVYLGISSVVGGKPGECVSSNQRVENASRGREWSLLNEYWELITVEATVTLSGEVLVEWWNKGLIRVGLSENGLFFVLILSPHLFLFFHFLKKSI